METNLLGTDFGCPYRHGTLCPDTEESFRNRREDWNKDLADQGENLCGTPWYSDKCSNFWSIKEKELFALEETMGGVI